MVHYHQIRYGHELHIEAQPSNSKEILDYDGSVCLICSRANTSQVFTYDFKPFQAEITSSPLPVDDKPFQIISTEHILASPRAPPLV